MDITKGEWKVDKDDLGYTIKSEQSIVKGFEEDNDVEIATMNGYLDVPGETEANAHLLAAAPDMYEALKDFGLSVTVGYNDELNPYWYIDQEWFDKMAAALARAEGK